MYTVMVVEDEYIERQALVMMLRGNFPELSITGESGNGFEAVSQAYSKKPDLVLVDVGLPGKNGLDVIAEIQSFSPETTFIIISSHDNFEFAQRAIQLGVEDYLLKPIRLESLRAAISSSVSRKESRYEASTAATNLLNRMESIRPLIESDFIYSVVSGGQSEAQRKLLAFLGYENSSGVCLVISLRTGANHPHVSIKSFLENTGQRALSGFFNNQSIIYFLMESGAENDSLEELCRITLTYLENNYKDFYIGVSELVAGGNNWSTAYRQARIALQHAEEEQQRIKRYDRAVMFYSDGIPENPANGGGKLAIWVSLFVRNILDNREDQLEKLAGEICLALMSGNEFYAAREEAYKLIILLEQELKKALPVTELRTDEDAGILKADEPRHLEMCLLSHVKRLFRLIHETRDQNKNYFVDRAVMYIKTNYQKEISLGSIANEINVSPYYLSKLFRKYTGKTCTELIAEERIEAAKRLLIQNYSSKETCFQVGFNSQNYFVKIFKKYVGVTPGEYRNASI
ncbi:AraC family transcriptional regulator [Treponema sp. TIM-1]|uniref:helix-turn-helix domain-containing protein n=1 Tax=Treponema sp. TIM-1 TaxID=2898417 RepID=UPI0039812359